MANNKNTVMNLKNNVLHLTLYCCV